MRSLSFLPDKLLQKGESLLRPQLHLNQLILQHCVLPFFFHNQVSIVLTIHLVFDSEIQVFHLIRLISEVQLMSLSLDQIVEISALICILRISLLDGINANEGAAILVIFKESLREIPSQWLDGACTNFQNCDASTVNSWALEMCIKSF